MKSARKNVAVLAAALAPLPVTGGVIGAAVADTRRRGALAA